MKLPGGLEIGLQAVNRAERVRGGLFESTDDRLGSDDDVEVTRRPLEGDTRRQFEAVQDRLQTRLRFIHTVVFALPEVTEANYPSVIREVDERRLLKPDELELVRDVAGHAEDSLEVLKYEFRMEFLDANGRRSGFTGLCCTQPDDLRGLPRLSLRRHTHKEHLPDRLAQLKEWQGRRHGIRFERSARLAGRVSESWSGIARIVCGTGFS